VIRADSIELATGGRIPLVGFGVYGMNDLDTERAVLTALEAGYRAIDTASVYKNERAVGRALAASGIPRSELMVTTKLWNSDQGDLSVVRPALEASLERLGLSSIDLFLIHWPNPAAAAFVPTWAALEQLSNEGLASTIGVSNFTEEQLRELTHAGLSVPAVNQIERHPLHAQRELSDTNTRLGITTVAWSPLGRGMLVSNPVIASIAEQVGRTMGQVMLRWNVQSGIAVIPKSSTPTRIRENLDVLSFVLSPEQMSLIDSLDAGVMADPTLAARFQ